MLSFSHTLSRAFAGALLLVVVPVLGCKTTTTIYSEPPGAMVYEKGEELGETPLEYSSKDLILKKRRLELELPGYETAKVTLERDEMNSQVLVASVVLIFVFWPAALGAFLAGGMDYAEEHNVRLRPDDGSKPTARPRSSALPARREDQQLAQAY